jgi:hypothetical protein
MRVPAGTVTFFCGAAVAASPAIKAVTQRIAFLIFSPLKP